MVSGAQVSALTSWQVLEENAFALYVFALWESKPKLDNVYTWYTIQRSWTYSIDFHCKARLPQAREFHRISIFNRRWRVPPATWLPGERVQGVWSIEYIIRHYRTDLHGHIHIYLHLDTYIYLPRCIGVHSSEALGATCALLIISWAPGMTFDNREHHTK